MDRKNFESGWNRYCEKLNESNKDNNKDKSKNKTEGVTLQEGDSRFPTKKEFKPFEPKPKEGDRWALKAQALRDKEKTGKGDKEDMVGADKVAKMIEKKPPIKMNSGEIVNSSVYKLSPPYEEDGTEYEHVYVDSRGNEPDPNFAMYGALLRNGKWEKEGDEFYIGFQLGETFENTFEKLGYTIEGNDSDPVPERKLDSDNDLDNDLGSRLNQDHRKRHPEIYKPFKDPNSGEERYFPRSVHESWKEMLSGGLWESELDEARNKDPNLRPKRIDPNNEEDMQQVMAARELMGQQDQNRTAGQQKRVAAEQQKKQNIIAQKKMNRSARPGRIDPNDEKQMQQVAAGRALSQKQDQNRAMGQPQSQSVPPAQQSQQVVQGQGMSRSNLTPEQKKQLEDRRIAAEQRRKEIRAQQPQQVIQPPQPPQQQQQRQQWDPSKAIPADQSVPRQRKQSVGPPSAAEQLGISQEEFDRRKAERKAGQKNLRGAFNESIHQDWKSYLKRGLLNESADIINMGDYKKRKEMESAVKEAELSYELASLISDISYNRFGENSEEYESILEWLTALKTEVDNLEQSCWKTCGNLDFINRDQISQEAMKKLPEYLNNLNWEPLFQ